MFKSIQSIYYLITDLKRAWGKKEPFPLAFMISPFIWITVWNNIYYRICRAIYLLPFPFNKLLSPVRHLIKRIIQVVTSTDISERADIGPRFYIAHNGTLVIGAGMKAGSDFFVRQGVTIGGDGVVAGHPIFGDKVVLGANAVVIGKIEIGSGVIIGANSVVTKSFPSDCVIAGVPARIIRMVNK